MSTESGKIKRGFVAEGEEKNYSDTSPEQRISLLKSKLPRERTLGARLLRKHPDSSAITHLISALKHERKLYPKIEICTSLVSYGNDSVRPLISILGQVGTNQHKTIPDTVFKKKSYPLPRDIAARTLIRIGAEALPELLKILESEDLLKLSEAIDAIGYICFYHHQVGVLDLLLNCYQQNQKQDLIRWKIFRAMSAFPESEKFLLEQQSQIKTMNLQLEIKRSLSLLQKTTNIN